MIRRWSPSYLAPPISHLAAVLADQEQSLAVVQALATPELTVEIEAIAAVPARCARHR